MLSLFKSESSSLRTLQQQQRRFGFKPTSCEMSDVQPYHTFCVSLGCILLFAILKWDFCRFLCIVNYFKLVGFNLFVYFTISFSLIYFTSLFLLFYYIYFNALKKFS